MRVTLLKVVYPPPPFKKKDPNIYNSFLINEKNSMLLTSIRFHSEGGGHEFLILFTPPPMDATHHI